MDRYNLFRFATDDASHSAFWAWTFQATDAEETRLEGPKAVGESALRLLDGPTPPGPVEVEADVSFPLEDRPDLRVDLGDERSVFVVLQKNAEFSPAKIEEYRKEIGETDRIALISTQFNADRAAGTCPYLGLDDIRELLWSHRDSHPLLSDYADWIDTKKEEREAIQQKAFSETPEELATALSGLYGQKLLMEEIAEPLDGWMTQKHKRRSGDPCTDFHFAEADSDQDALFYRIDEYASGYHVSLKQYLDGRDHEAWSGKEERLERLRQWWTEAVEQSDHSLDFQAPHNNGAKTREVACLLFKQNPPGVVADDLPAIHRTFTEILEENGWALGPSA